MSGTIPAYGPSVWIDVTDNWRSEDAEWLMDRSVLRYAAVVPTLDHGQVAFNDTTSVLQYGSSSGNRTVLASGNVSVIDASTNATLVNRTAGTGGLTISNDGTINVVTSAIVGNPASNRVTFDVASSSGRATFVGATVPGGIVVSVANTRLEVSAQLFAPSMITNTLAVNASGTFIMGAGSSAILQAVTAVTITATTITLGSGTLTAAGGTVSAQTVSGTGSVTVGSGGLAPLTGANTGVTFPSNTSVLLRANTGGTVSYQIGTGSGTTSPLAGWKVSNVPPTPSDLAPDGTIWFVV